MAGGLDWDAAAPIALMSWLLSPIITLLTPKILSCLGLDASQKLWDLKIHIIPELQQTLREVDQARMLQRGEVSDVSTLDEMASWLRHARGDADDIFDDAQEKIVSAVTVQVRGFHAVEIASFCRNWSYDVVGIKSNQENATAFDFVLAAILRWNLKKRIEKVERTVNEVKKSLLLGVARKSTPTDIANKNRSRIRTATKRKVFGREVLRDDIIARLRETPQDDAQNSSTSPCYSVLGIYGVTGSGKTTFARYTRDYIEQECKGLFDIIMCIHVSETFSLDDMFHEMLKDITKDRHSDISDREELEEKLKESLSGKRFFLILDDIWVKAKNDPQLDELISPLHVGMKGSKILVMTRRKVAARALCDDEPIEMSDLDEDIYFSMFMHYAVGGTSVVDKEEFVQVGRVIAEKLHQSPIAAVAVAGQLGANLDIKFWKNTANHDMLSNTMDALWWSYQSLNLDIRRCFEFCNIFPRRFELRRDELVCMWIAQGFVKTSSATEDMEVVANDYIHELVSCSFLQQEVTSSDTDSFRIHDLLHDLLDKVAGSDCFRIENDRSQRGERWKADVPQDVRHLFVQNYDANLIAEKILRLENLRTLIIYVVEERDTPVEEKVIENICKRMPKLWVLSIVWPGIIASKEYCAIIGTDRFSVPESISQLKHLRYFAFRTHHPCMVILPSTLHKLHRIQLLDFYFGEISEFTSIGLINLRHIFYGSWDTFANIGRLISLQKLPHFRVRNEQGYEVKQLRNLNQLGGSLEICGLENVKSKEEALEANLAAKERLTHMYIRWGDDDVRCSPEVEAEVLEGLCPPMGLQTLHIVSYEGSRYPDWMVCKQNNCPKDLRQIRFDRCIQLGPAPKLEAFPHLSVLWLQKCSWDALPGNMEHLASLKSMQITGCLNIWSLPTLPQSLEVFTLYCCNHEFMKSCETMGHPNWQKIEHIPQKYFYQYFYPSSKTDTSRKHRGTPDDLSSMMRAFRNDGKTVKDVGALWFKCEAKLVSDPAKATDGPALRPTRTACQDRISTP
ncbi:putative disease resistance protein RGA3 [Triticum dicoccoides]|uniref:putative disease resistance protein RGA3 n=1 Tax=Triticum dicoccoides TaxID=85692 RepID=UPI00188E0C30|nr:putative disease resistance protein RGA3 [Triticum dicoccoides]